MKRMTIGRSLGAVVLSAAMLFTAGCSNQETKPADTAKPSTDASSAAGAAQSLTIYTGRDKNEVAQVIKEFEAAHPQYKGKVTSVIAGAQDNLDRLRAEKGNPQAGFLWGGTQQQLEQAANEGLLMEAKDFKYGAKIEAKYKDPDNKWFAEMLLPEVIIYNKALVKPEDAPKDWDDLITDKYNGKIVIRDVMPSGTMRTIYSAMVYRQYVKNGNDPAKGYEWLKKMDENTVSYAANPDDMYTQLDQGVGTVTVWNLQDALIQPLKNNRPWQYVMPSSGAPILVDGVGIVNNPNQSQAATDFMNFLMEPKMQAKLAGEYYQLPAVPLDDKDKPEWMKDFKMNAMDIDWKVFGENQAEWMKYWSENIKSKK